MEKKLALASNIAILVLAVVLSVILIRNEFVRYTTLRSEGNFTPLQSLVGKPFPISEPWEHSRNTIVLALQVGCHFCSASAPFYQMLIRNASLKETEIVAMMPNSVSEGEQYLKKLNLDIRHVEQVDLRRIAVDGTPTLFLVNRTGIVVGVWQGQLNDTDQRGVLSAMQN
jgi:hypothetical protein